MEDRISFVILFFTFHGGRHRLLEKKGLHQTVDILEKYGIGSETDVVHEDTV
jgi:hypothetical protein